MELLTMPNNVNRQSWYSALQPEFDQPYFKQLLKFVEEERSTATVYPPPDQVFNWTNYFPINQVKVVILGQNPYHKPNQAHGLAFSVPVGVPPPRSLANIYKELIDDQGVPGFTIPPSHGNLSGWASQGVLLLNTCLTVRASQANSHAGRGWEQFTDAVIALVSNNNIGVVFMLWGVHAQKKAAYIDVNRHCILSASHPSPLSSYRGFLGCKHFSMANNYLMQQGKTPINWTHLP